MGDFMDYIQIALTSIGAIVVLFILTKFMGYRQMSQLSMFDYINGITIGSIAAEMATSLENDFLKPLIAMVIFTAVTILLSYSTTKSLKLRRWITGTSYILFDHQKLYRNNLKKAKLDLDEMLVQCRNAGFFDLSQIETIILEPNGKLSILPQAEFRPLTPFDTNKTLPEDSICINLIIDGSLLIQNLQASGNNENWLKKQMQAQKFNLYSDIVLAFVDRHNTLTIYPKINDNATEDYFI